jgi:hypothetical protein
LPYIIQTYEIDDTDWTPIIPPSAVMGWSIRNTSSQYEVLIRTDQADAGTEDNIPASAWEIVTLSAYRSNENFPILWAKSSNGTITLKARFIS